MTTRTWTKVHRTLLTNHRYSNLQTSESRLLYRHALDLADDRGHIDRENLYIVGFRPFRKDRERDSRNRFEKLFADIMQVGLVLATSKPGLFELYKFSEKTKRVKRAARESTANQLRKNRSKSAGSLQGGLAIATTYAHRTEEEEEGRGDSLRESGQPAFRTRLWERIKAVPGLNARQAKPIMAAAFRAVKTDDWVSETGAVEAAGIAARAIVERRAPDNIHAFLLEVARKESLRIAQESSETEHRGNLAGSKTLAAILANGRIGCLTKKATSGFERN